MSGSSHFADLLLHARGSTLFILKIFKCIKLIKLNIITDDSVLDWVTGLHGNSTSTFLISYTAFHPYVT